MHYFRQNVYIKDKMKNKKKKGVKKTPHLILQPVNSILWVGDRCGDQTGDNTGQQKKNSSCLGFSS